MPINQPGPEPVDEEGVAPQAPLAEPDGIGGADADGADADGAGTTAGDEYEPL